MHHSIRGLAEVLDNLGVFRAPRSGRAVPVGVSPVPISTGSDYFLSLQYFEPHQIAYAHTHPDSEERVIVLGGNGHPRFGTAGAAVAQSGDDRRPGRAPPARVLVRARARCPCSRCSSRAELRARPRGTSPEQRRIPFHAGRPGRPCRLNPRCGSHSAPGPTGAFRCENLLVHVLSSRRSKGCSDG
jgi:hypothetical protein